MSDDTKWKSETYVERMHDATSCSMPSIGFSEQYDSTDNGCAIHALQHLLHLNGIRVQLDHAAVWDTANRNGLIIDGGIAVSDVHKCLDSELHDTIRRQGMLFRSLNMHDGICTREQLRKVIAGLRDRETPFVFAYHGHAYCAYGFHLNGTCVLNSASKARVSVFQKGLWHSNRWLWMDETGGNWQ